ncbi:T9SS type A sorting domain-containing protein [Flavobacterium sp. N1994]|uniref:T9SS type A sorting domain-containing protein n=1 Tax=Flavobacterium sp. N1994 TaxID=2986827 RepID=UPI002221616E|nr:T9SS type A sorting domain-containing protein [Flavobacterium sp. N1994]
MKKSYLKITIVLFLFVNHFAIGQCFKEISSGVFYEIAIKTDGTLWSWGGNFIGALGDGTTISRSIPAQIGTDTHWSRISAGSGHTLAIKSDGTLWGWGHNHDGLLGDGTYVDKYIPTQIGTNSNWITIVDGYDHILSLTTDGTLWAWGFNASGQLGDGTNVGKNIPIQIDTNTNWDKISGKPEFTSALKTDGSLWVWGYNKWGQLGDGTTINRYLPTAIVCPATLATETIIPENNFKIYPNPVAANLTIEGNEAILQTIIIDCNGRVIQMDKHNETSATISLERVQAGVYFLKIITEKGTVTAKIIKNN